MKPASGPPIPINLVERVRSAQSIVVLTGAGVSAESGVPTFRDAQTGLWTNYRPEDLATPEAFQRNPRLVWEWYAMRREKVLTVAPNPGHRALVAMERVVREFLLVTQNVDGLHQRAGSRQVCELHGNIGRTKCFQENRVIEQWVDDGQVPPRCPQCGGWLRPDVVWFNEALPKAELIRATSASRRCQVFFSVGTSAMVYPAAGLSQEAFEARAVVVEINPQPTPLTERAHHFLQGPSGVILPELVRAVWGEQAVP